MSATIRDTWQTLRSALFLEDSVFEAFRDAPDGVARGLRLIVSLGLIVGLIVSLVGYLQQLGTSPAEEVAEAITGVTQVFEQMETMGVFGDPEAAEMVLGNIRAGMEMGRGIAEAVESSTPAPMPIATLFQALGKWLSWPFSWISMWLLWGVLTLIFARMLGGTATIQQMLATSSLVVAPHLLDALGWLPCVGAILGLVAWIWAVAVHVKATMVANRLPAAPALLAVFLPVIIPGVLFGGLLFLIVALVAMS